MPRGRLSDRSGAARWAALAATAVLAACLMLLGVLLPGQAVAGPYPPTQCATLAVSTTQPAAGEPITVTGANFTPGQTVTLELHSDPRVVGSAVVQSDGTFSTQVTIPSDLYGQHLLITTGGTPSCGVDPYVELQISASQIAGEAIGPNSGGSSGLSSTGVQIALLLAIAAFALVVGAGVTRAGKARRTRV